MKKNLIDLLSLLLVALFMAFTSNKANAQTAQTPNLTGVTSYYVRANGSDSNTGTSENTPFKTLTKAVETASKTKVKKITVIGTLIGQTKISNSGVDEILITGKQNASNSEKAILTSLPSVSEEISTIKITGNSNIKLEHLTVITESTYSIIYAEGENVKLTLGKNAVIFGNTDEVEYLAEAGGGILMIDGTLIMTDNAIVTNCFAGFGGGIAVSGGKMFMQDNSVISNNKAKYSGGGVYLEDSNLELKDNAVIKGNTANKVSLDSGGGGIYCTLGTIKLHDNSSVTGNSAPYGGGIFLQMSGIQTKDGVKADRSGVYESRHVSGNTATHGWSKQEISHNIFVNDH